MVLLPDVDAYCEFLDVDVPDAHAAAAAPPGHRYRRGVLYSDGHSLRCPTGRIIRMVPPEKM